MVWSTLFFVLLLLASLTSTISMGEISIAYFSEECGMSRPKATLLTSGICALFGTLCSLSFGPLATMTIFGMSFFDLFDFCSSNILLPLGGILISLYAGHVLGSKIIAEELTAVPRVLTKTLTFILRFIAPLGITLIFLSGLNLL